MRRTQADQIAAEIAQDWRGQLYKATIEPGLNPRYLADNRGWVIKAWDVANERWVTFAVPRDWERWKEEQR